MATDGRITNHAAFIWSVADLLRGDYKQSEYGRVILPLTVLRRLDCVLEPTKDEVLAQKAALEGRLSDPDRLDRVLAHTAGQTFVNSHPLTLTRILDDAPNAAEHLAAYIRGFSTDVRDVLDKFEFHQQITRLDRAGLLYPVLARFCEIDLHPDAVSNIEMGYLYEELIRRFSELSNETAGEHFTPREVIHLMVNLLFAEDDAALRTPGVMRTLYDPACGTGGMLSVAQDHLAALNPDATLTTYGQELNPETYAVCTSDLMLKGQNAGNVAFGNSFSEDGHPDLRVDYLLANPPFGVEWKKVEAAVRDEAAHKGYGGRFGAGLPRINDGSLLFLQHMVSKMKPAAQGGSRLAIVFNGSPLFTGAAGSGESEIRRWLIEQDMLEAVIALPDQLFYNTGISTYVWVVTNRKSPSRRGLVRLVDARSEFTKMRKSLGDKRKAIGEDQIVDVTRLYADGTDDERVKVFPNTAFGFMRITVERPLRLRWEVSDHTLAAVAEDRRLAKLGEDALGALVTALTPHSGLVSTDRAQVAAALAPDLKPLGLTAAQTKALMDCLAVRDPGAPVVTGKNGHPEPDPELRDNENVPLPEVPVAYEPDPAGRLATAPFRAAVDEYMAREVLPYVPDAWVDHAKTKIGYEIPLTRHFYRYTPPRPLEEIDAEIRALEDEIRGLLDEVLG